MYVFPCSQLRFWVTHRQIANFGWYSLPTIYIHRFLTGSCLVVLLIINKNRLNYERQIKSICYITFCLLININLSRLSLFGMLNLQTSLTIKFYRFFFVMLKSVKTVQKSNNFHFQYEFLINSSSSIPTSLLWSNWVEKYNHQINWNDLCFFFFVKWHSVN